ncbi:MAG: methylaspartate ammonia-lyase, partial [Planctomycetota bacterium]
MRIDKVTFSGGVSGFYFDDQRAIKEGARRDGFAYKGEPATRGFTAIRQPGESISFILRLENGAIARGDAAAVQYSGAHGRSPLFIAEQHLPHLRNRLGPALEGLELNSFRDAIRQVDRLDEAETIHPAVRYGLSQAVLEAVALARNALKVEVICEEYDLPLVPEPLPIFGQSGDHRHEGADKMILKEADVLPHGLLNNVREKIGTRGEKLREYLTWLTGRIRELRLRDDYQPTLHIDVYGNLGSVFDRDTERIADYLGRLDDITEEFPLYVEGPV